LAQGDFVVNDRISSLDHSFLFFLFQNGEAPKANRRVQKNKPVPVRRATASRLVGSIARF
jgi:hypothetical protein